MIEPPPDFPPSDPSSPRPRVRLAPAMLASIAAFGLLYVVVLWAGARGAILYLLAGVTLAIISTPRLRRRETWWFYLIFVALAASLLWRL